MAKVKVKGTKVAAEATKICYMDTLGNGMGKNLCHEDRAQDNLNKATMYNQLTAKCKQAPLSGKLKTLKKHGSTCNRPLDLYVQLVSNRYY